MKGLLNKNAFIVISRKLSFERGIDKPHQHNFGHLSPSPFPCGQMWTFGQPPFKGLPPSFDFKTLFYIGRQLGIHKGGSE